MFFNGYHSLSNFVSLPILSPRSPFCPSRRRQFAISADSSFTWDDVFRVPQNDSSSLSGYLDKVNLCNRNLEKKCEFMPFVIEDQTIGYVHHGFADFLKPFHNVFIFPQDNTYGSHFECHCTLHPNLSTPKDRTNAVADVIKSLGELIPGIRNEFYPVASAFGEPIFFSLERAAAPYFGIKAYGVQMNGYLEKDEQKFLWIGKRSKQKSTYPGMLDQLVAGGLPSDISCGENLIKECEEEAGIPRSISHKAIPVGVVSYIDIEGYRMKRDVLFCYDLKLPDGFIPHNEDGEVESFRLVPVTQVASIIRNTPFFKANCNLVIIDFLFRHGILLSQAEGLSETTSLPDFLDSGMVCVHLTLPRPHHVGIYWIHQTRRVWVPEATAEFEKWVLFLADLFVWGVIVSMSFVSWKHEKKKEKEKKIVYPCPML